MSIFRRRRRHFYGVGGNPLAPQNSVAPELSGNFFVGQTLTCSTGTWTNSPTGYTYQWQNNGVNISGATSNTYTLVADDDKDLIRCRVTATNANGSKTANSNELYAIQLDLWLDASDTTTITHSGGSVSAWNDKSGAGRNLSQGAGTNQPLTGTATINSLNAIRFDGTNDHMQMAALTGINGNYKAFFVVSDIPSGSTASVRRIMGGSNGTGGQRFNTAIEPNTFRFGLGGLFAQPNNYISVAADFSLGQFLAWGYTVSTTNTTALFNQTEVTTNLTTLSTYTPTSVRIGSNDAGSGEYYNGDIGEIIYLRNANPLNVAALEQIRDYLALKWGTPL